MTNADVIKVLLIGDAGEAAALAREELAFPAPGTLEITSAQYLDAAARRIATGSVDVVLLDLGDKSEFELESLSEIQTQAPTTLSSSLPLPIAPRSRLRPFVEALRIFSLKVRLTAICCAERFDTLSNESAATTPFSPVKPAFEALSSSRATQSLFTTSRDVCSM